MLSALVIVVAFGFRVTAPPAGPQSFQVNREDFLMGWNLSMLMPGKRLFQLTLAALALTLAPVCAHAQAGGGGGGGGTGGGGGGGTGTLPPPVTITNGYLILTVFGDGSILLTTGPANPTDPSSATTPEVILYPTDPANAIAGTRLFIRVDGGLTNFQNSQQQGWDDVFGSGFASNGSSTSGFGFGQWISPPTVVGNHIEARYETDPVLVLGSSNSNLTFTYLIEVDMFASFVHDNVRFEFDVKNADTGSAHTVSLAFLQNIVAVPPPTGSLIATADGPLRLPNQPYLHHEAEFFGSQVPQHWDTFSLISAASGNTPAKIHSIRGTLKPASSTQPEPTPPNRFEYGRSDNVVGDNPNCPALKTFNIITAGIFDCLWNFFTPDPTIILDRPAAGSGASGDASVGLFWEGQSMAPTATSTIVTFVGQSDTDFDSAPPMALSVGGPIALGFAGNSGTTNQASSTPNPFVITAYVQNLTDIIKGSGGGINLGPVNLFLSLPQGLAFAPGETAAKQIASVSPGTEGSVQWSVMADGTANGNLTYTVSATPNLGNGKIVQRSVEVPAPPTVTLIGNSTTKGQFQMLSFPLLFGNATPSSILFPNIPVPPNAPPFDLVRWDPANGRYSPVTTFTPGLGYWLRSQLPGNTTITLDTSKYPPLDNQVLPNATAYKVNYPKGWNQIGDPFVYGVRFSEIQIFDSASLQLVTMADAADPVHQWVLPVAYLFDTSDADPRNWHYVMLDNLGFIMQPTQGYWMLVKRDGLQFVYPGVDTPGSSVTRAALLGVGIGSTQGKTTTTNWRLQLDARGTDTSDLMNYIGVAPKASDGPDVYKYDKPPLMGNHVSLDIVHSDWSGGGRYAQDLRSPAPTRKTWDLLVRSAHPNEDVTVTWPGFNGSVPRNYQLTLIDMASNVQRIMRTTSSYTVKTDANGTHRLQIVAQPTNDTGRVRITAFDIVSSGRAAGPPSSVAIHYSLTQTAQAQIAIRDRSGRTIRTLVTTTRAATGGDPNSGSAVWDLRDQRGISLAPGLYNVELTVLSQDGQQKDRQIRPYLLSR